MELRIISNEELISIYALFDDLRHLASWHGEITPERSSRIAAASEQLESVLEILDGLLPKGVLTERFHIIEYPNTFPPRWKEGYIRDENGRKIMYITIFELISFSYYCKDMLARDAYTDKLVFERMVYSFLLLYKAIISKKIRPLVDSIVSFL